MRAKRTTQTSLFDPDPVDHPIAAAALEAMSAWLLDDPEKFRKHANTKYIENEFKRSRALFDRIEAQPLTDEQRKAVVIDEERNLWPKA